MLEDCRVGRSRDHADVGQGERWSIRGLRDAIAAGRDEIDVQREGDALAAYRRRRLGS
jgi:hypothetical protein